LAGILDGWGLTAGRNRVAIAALGHSPGPDFLQGDAPHALPLACHSIPRRHGAVARHRAKREPGAGPTAAATRPTAAATAPLPVGTPAPAARPATAPRPAAGTGAKALQGRGSLSGRADEGPGFRGVTQADR